MWCVQRRKVRGRSEEGRKGIGGRGKEEIEVIMGNKTAATNGCD